MRCNIRHRWHGLIYAALLVTGGIWAANPKTLNASPNEQAQTALSTPMDCPADEETFSSAQGKFRLLICTPVPPAKTDDNQYENAPRWGQLKFIHQNLKGEEIITDWPLDVDWLSSWVGGEGLQFWSDHLLTLDIGSERGGILYIANWVGDKFVISEYLYMTGDEDSMTLSWTPSGFLVDTVPDGVRRLILQTGNSSMLGKFVPE